MKKALLIFLCLLIPFIIGEMIAGWMTQRAIDSHVAFWQAKVDRELPAGSAAETVRSWLEAKSEIFP